ncbi:dephospho-CoA kinase [Thermococci archaeon]|nr:MAG: dephospho-CoA kinase [Thermococci archaeon]
MIICVVGMPGSGKGEVVKVFRRFGVPHVNMGDIVREEASKRGIPRTSEGMRRVSIQLRQELGDNAVAKLCIPKLRKLLEGHEKVVVDGVRSLDEIRTFRDAFPEETIVVIGVHSSPKKRFERLSRRGRSDDPSTWDEFEARDWKELKFGVGEVMALADYLLVNEDSLDEYRMRILQLAKELGILKLPKHGIKEQHHVETEKEA